MSFLPLFASLSHFNCLAYLYLTLQDKYLHQGACQFQAQREGCRQALLGPPGPQARRGGRRRGYRFPLQGLIGGREGLWALVSFYGSFNVLGLLQAFKTIFTLPTCCCCCCCCCSRGCCCCCCCCCYIFKANVP